MTLDVSIIIIVVKMITGNSTWFGEWNELFMTLYNFSYGIFILGWFCFDPILLL